ncbi:hypothetical protein JKG47_07540 [Acidithiobacillus sp. MC6.1]|nr:hypothetical protein [Acidithiobacillus sp. MC6.1]
MSADHDIETARLTRMIGSLPGGIPLSADALLRAGGDASDLAAACLFSEDRTVAMLVARKLEQPHHDVTLNAVATLVQTARTIDLPEMTGAIHGDNYLQKISESGKPLKQIHPYLPNRTPDGRDDLTTLVSAAAFVQKLPEGVVRQAWDNVIGKVQPIMYPVAQNFLHHPDEETAPRNGEVENGADQTILTETFLKALETPASDDRFTQDDAVPPAIPSMGSMAAYTSPQYVPAIPDCTSSNDSMMAIVRGMRADGLNVQAENPLCVVAHVLDGSLHMPPAARFYSAGDYNAAMLHEMAHAAGEENRDDRAQRVHYGLTDTISRQEEIVADLTALSLSHRYANAQVNQHQLLCHAREQAGYLRQGDPGQVDARAIAALNDLAERCAQYIHGAVTRHIASAVNTATPPEPQGLRIRNGLLETHKAITRLEGHITISKMAPAIASERSGLDLRQQRLFDALHDRIGVTSEHIERASNLIAEMPSPETRVRELRALHDRLTAVHNHLGTVPDYLAPKMLQGVVAQQISGVDAHLIDNIRARMENEKTSSPTQDIHHLHTLKKGPK